MTEGSQLKSNKPALPAWKRGLFTAVFCLAVFIVLEVLCILIELVFPPTPADIGAGFTPESKLFEESSDGMLYETKKRKQPYFCLETFKKEKPADTFRLFALGGSSVNYLQKDFDELENSIIRKLAKEHGLILLDVKRAIIKSEPNNIPGETLFKDHCHLNDKGNAIIREMLKSYLEKLLN